jgi:hypothetical protein
LERLGEPGCSQGKRFRSGFPARKQHKQHGVALDSSVASRERNSPFVTDQVVYTFEGSGTVYDGFEIFAHGNAQSLLPI